MAQEFKAHSYGQEEAFQKEGCKKPEATTYEA
jgi:hypothetical protein